MVTPTRAEARFMTSPYAGLHGTALLPVIEHLRRKGYRPHAPMVPVMVTVRVILAMTALGAFGQANDTLPLLVDCSGSPSEPADVAATIHKSDAVRVRYSL